MNYNILNDDTFGMSLLDVVLDNRGLTESQMKELLNPGIENVEIPFHLLNMDKAIELFIKELDNESNIGILLDTDVDGYTSSALLYQFLVKECNYDKSKIQLFLHENKEHGLTDEKVLKEIKKSNIDFLIMPDAGTNDLKEVKELLKLGKKVLTLDHHHQNNEEDVNIIKDQNGNLVYVLVNNQLKDVSKSLSGVGVVWKFLSAMTEDELEHYLDLVAVGNVADSMNINDLELRYIVNKGLSNIKNKLFKELLDKESYTPTDVSFNIANKINAVCRYGSAEEKLDTFKALAEFEEEREYKNRKTGKSEMQSIEKYMARVIGNVKTRQDNAVKESMKKVSKYIEDNNCLDHKIILIVNEKKGNGLLRQNIGGLVATKIADKYKRPTIILHKHEDIYSGSMRGFGVDDFASILQQTEIVETIGHKNASGVFVKKSDIPRLMKRLDRVMEDVDISLEEKGHDVDCVIDIDDLTKHDFKQFESMKKIWFGFCKEPVFLIKDVVISEAEFRNPFVTLLTFKYNGYKFDKNFCSKVFLDDVLHRTEKRFGRVNFKCNILVKLGTNEFNKDGYFEVVDMETEIVDKKEDKKIPF